MGKIAGMLERSLAERPVHPVIVEFSTLDAMREMAPALKKAAGMGRLEVPHAPIGDILPLGDRVLSRFQAGLFSFKQIPRFKMIASILSTDLIGDLAADPKVVRIYPDQIQTISQTVPPEGVFEHRKKLHTTTRWVRTLVGADKANEEGWTGKGVRLAVVDTGGSPALPQTAGFAYASAMREKAQIKDSNGHGEHVASIACGRRYYDRTLKHEVVGMAPEATGILIKSLGFVVGMGAESDILEGMSMALDREADVVNLSLGVKTMPDDPGEDAECVAIRTLAGNNIIPVVAAGNWGPNPGTVGTPGCCPEAVTVGAWDEINGGVCDFTSRGPTKWGVKPDLVAPGFEIYSQCLGVLDMADRLENRMAYLSGTSMSAPVAAGLIACARQMFAEHGIILTAEMVKDAMSRFGPNQPKDNDQGWGIITWDILERYLKEVMSG